MKHIFVILVSVLLISCDPDNKDIFNLESVKISGSINNINEIMVLGDTLKIDLQLPDTIINSSGVVSVQSLQKAQFYMRILKVDTINNRVISISPPLYWTTKGNISPTNSYDFEFSNNAKPYGVNINFKPSEKGIYYLEVVSQAGQLKINNSYEARLIVTFSVPDKHINLATPYLGSAWANEAMTREYGIYVFRVN